MDNRAKSKAAAAPIEIQRPVAGEIPCPEQPLLPFIPNHKCEIANQMCGRLLPPPLVCEEDQQAVGKVLPVLLRYTQRLKQFTSIINDRISRNGQLSLRIIVRQWFIYRLRSNPL
ncbi:hypothetical protein D3C75_1033940 [compost metagenome]